MKLWDMSVEQSQSLAHRILDYEIRTATEIDSSGQLPVLSVEEWERKREER